MVFKGGGMAELTNNAVDIDKSSLVKVNTHIRTLILTKFKVARGVRQIAVFATVNLKYEWRWEEQKFKFLNETATRGQL